MALEIEVLCAGYPVGDEDLSYIVRFGRGGIAVDNVLQLTCKYLADRVARKGCDFFRRQNDDNRPSDVAGRLCAHPRIIALCVFTRRDCLRFRRGFGIVCVRDPLALLDLLVALESKRFDHVDGRSGSEVGASESDELPIRNAPGGEAVGGGSISKQAGGIGRTSAELWKSHTSCACSRY